MTKKAQTIFTVCFVAFLISVVSLSFVFADSIPHSTETPQITGGYTSFNFLVSILYTQLFQQLFYVADHEYGGCLPVPVHFLMDEFANETQL